MSGDPINKKNARTNTPRSKNTKIVGPPTRSTTRVPEPSISLSFDKNSLPSIDHLTAKSKSAFEKVDSNDIEHYSTTTLPLRPVAMETAVPSPSDSVISLCDKVAPPSDTVTSPFGSDLPSRAHAHLLRREFTKKMGKYGYITYDAKTRTYAVDPGFKILKGRNGKDRLVIDGMGDRGGATTADTVRGRIKANDAVKPTNKKEAHTKEMRRLVLLKELQVRKAEAAVCEDEDDFATPSREMVAWVVAPVEGWLSEEARGQRTIALSCLARRRYGTRHSACDVPFRDMCQSLSKRTVKSSSN